MRVLCERHEDSTDRLHVDGAGGVLLHRPHPALVVEVAGQHVEHTRGRLARTLDLQVRVVAGHHQVLVGVVQNRHVTGLTFVSRHKQLVCQINCYTTIMSLVHDTHN